MSPEGPTPSRPSPAPQGCDLFTPWHSSASVSLTLEKPCISPRSANSRYSSRQHLELVEHAVHAALVDGVEAIGRRGDGREADLVEAQVVLQMAVDAEHVGDARGERDARGDGPRAVACDQRADAGLDDVVAAAAVGEDAELVVQFLGAIHADRHADVVFGEELDDGGSEQGGVGGEAEIDGAALRRRPARLA